MPFFAVNEGLVKDFQHVALDLIEAEAAHMRKNAAHEVLAIGVINYPIKEIALGCAIDASGLKHRAGQDMFRIVVS